MDSRTIVYADERLASYHFGEQHPFGPARFSAFRDEFLARGLDKRCTVGEAVAADRSSVELFHTPAYVERVIEASTTGVGYLDRGDTPAVRGIYEAAALVAGSVLDGVERVMNGEHARAFVPIAGLHHARRDSAAGFCVFNDCGIAIEALRGRHDIRRVAYVDIDAHHGDGVFYAFKQDPDLIFADLHEDGRFLYPGTGAANETGRGAAEGTKLNIPMRPGARDVDFHTAWERVESYLAQAEPEFFILQCGADSIKGDPITHLAYSPDAHRHAANRLRILADRYAGGRLLALGGGGYNLQNIAAGWNAVVEALTD
ncbi:MAG: acetoin utilization protein AcuC [Pseudomonadota bacterium]|nr:acetoin utilization protein AcuC [Pseudomonadota bacterium]